MPPSVWVVIEITGDYYHPERDIGFYSTEPLAREALAKYLEEQEPVPWSYKVEEIEIDWPIGKDTVR